MQVGRQGIVKPEPASSWHPQCLTVALMHTHSVSARVIESGLET